MSMALNLQLPLPTGSLEAYVDAVQRIPLLSLEEEQDLARRYREHGDLDAARELVLAHLRFVVSVARRYKGYGLAHGDLIEEGNIGLMKAVKRFDPDVGVRLVSFAVHWIKAEIHEFVIKNWRIVKVATTKAQRKLFFNLRSAKKTLGWMGAEEVEDAARDFGVETRDVLTMEQRLSARDVSFDLRSDDDEDPFVPAAYLQDQRFEPSLCYEQEEAESVRTERLGEALGELDARSRDIVVSRWLLDPKMTLQKLAEKYEVSAERIRQLEKSAFKTLKNQIPDLEETIAAEPVTG